MAGVTSRLLVALGADRDADPTTWTLTDFTERTMLDTWAIRRGRAGGGAQETQPAAVTMLMDNGDGFLTPGNPASDYAPDLVRGVPVIIDVEAGDPTLLTFDSSGGASTPDHASLDITGDIALAVEVESPLRIHGTDQYDLIGKWTTASDQRSYSLLLEGDGRLSIFWTTAGTAASTLSLTTTLPVPTYDAGPAVYAAYLDVSNAGTKTATFYVGRGTIADLIADPDAFVFEQKSSGSTTSIFSSTAILRLAVIPDTTARDYVGRIRRAIVVSGSLAGSIVANPIFTAQTPGATSFADSTGKTWTLGANADIDGHNVRLVGQLDAVKPTYPGHGVEDAAQVTWEIAGPLRRLRQGDAPIGSSLFRHISTGGRNQRVIAYWPWEDGANATQVAPGIEGIEPITNPSADIRFAANSTYIASNPLPSVNAGDSISWNAKIPIDPTPPSSFWRIDSFIFLPEEPAASYAYLGVRSTGVVTSWGIFFDASNVTLLGNNAAGSTVINATLANDDRFYGNWMLVSLVAQNIGGDVHGFLELIPIVEFPAGVAFSTSDTETGAIGAPHEAFMFSGAPSGGVSWGHVVVAYDASLGWLAPADTAFDSEPAGSRFYRLCREQGIVPLVDAVYGGVGLSSWSQAYAKGAKPMGPQRPAKLLELLAECAEVEEGRIGEAREILNGLVLRGRSSHYNQAPVLTVTNELVNPFSPADDDQGVVNDITVSRFQGSSNRQFDAESIASAGIYDSTRTINTRLDEQLPDHAKWTLHEALWPEMRTPFLAIELGKNTGLYSSWLALREGDVVLCSTVPPWWPAEEIRQIVEGWTETISKVEWSLNVNGTPAGVWDVGLRDDGDRAIRDTGGSELNSSFVVSTATSMSVLTTSGPVWAVTGASNSALPFDLDVGGYRVTVTAIGAAAANVQTFTVSATTFPDIPKTLPAGTPVSVWQPARRAF